MKKENSITLCINGIMNIGNTCYLNTALKCISSAIPFIYQYGQAKLKSAEPYDKQFHCQFKSLLQNIFSTHGGTVSPYEFKSILQKIDPSFAGSSQCDCYQVIVSILYNAHKGLVDKSKLLINPFPTVELKCNKLLQKNEKIISYIKDSIKRMQSHQSIVFDMYLNMSYNLLECPSCGLEKIKFDITTGIAIDMADSSTLGECLSKHYSKCDYSGYMCHNCQKIVNIAITKIPIMFSPILIIQLKRFKFVEHYKIYTKDDSLVKYPFNDKLLEPTLYIPKSMKDYIYLADTTDLFKLPYHLIAEAIHHGSLEWGHYYANILNLSSKEWECHNDSSVSKMKKTDSDRSAITLVYIREDLYKNPFAQDTLLFSKIYSDIIGTIK